MKLDRRKVSVWLPVTVTAYVAAESGLVYEKGEVVKWDRAIEYADEGDCRLAIEEAINES